MTNERISDFRRKIEDTEHFLSTCDGGDIGTPESPSTWLLGIEPGWSLADQASEEQDDEGAVERYKQYPIDLQLGWRFNKSAFKLLHALAGGAPEDYLEFAERAQPFVRGSTGYFKANLFPVPFNSVKEWNDSAVAETGFTTKEEYRSWVRDSRVPVLKHWIERSRPKLVLGCGLTCSEDYLRAASVSNGGEVHHFEVNGHTKRLITTKSGVVPIAVIPHLSGGANGLNSYEAIRMAAGLIRKELQV